MPRYFRKFYTRNAKIIEIGLFFTMLLKNRGGFLRQYSISCVQGLLVSNYRVARIMVSDTFNYRYRQYRYRQYSMHNGLTTPQREPTRKGRISSNIKSVIINLRKKINAHRTSLWTSFIVFETSDYCGNLLKNSFQLKPRCWLLSKMTCSHFRNSTATVYRWGGQVYDFPVWISEWSFFRKLCIKNIEISWLSETRLIYIYTGWSRENRTDFNAL